MDSMCDQMLANLLVLLNLPKRIFLRVRWKMLAAARSGLYVVNRPWPFSFPVRKPYMSGHAVSPELKLTSFGVKRTTLPYFSCSSITLSTVVPFSKCRT